jgi:hypothetical protein
MAPPDQFPSIDTILQESRELGTEWRQSRWKTFLELLGSTFLLIYCYQIFLNFPFGRGPILLVFLRVLPLLLNALAWRYWGLLAQRSIVFRIFPSGREYGEVIAPDVIQRYEYHQFRLRRQRQTEALVDIATAGQVLALLAQLLISIL